MIQKFVFHDEDYAKAQKGLHAAIQRYDQAVLHLAASRITRSSKAKVNLILGIGDKWGRTDEDIHEWLKPSYHDVETQLLYFRNCRLQGTLEWATDMMEFKEWRLSDSKKLLWICGALGIGKTTMSAYLIDLLKTRYSNSIVAYFFCRSTQAELKQPGDIVRTLAFQCGKSDIAVRKEFNRLRGEKFPVSSAKIDYLTENLLRVPLSKSEKEIFFVLDGLDEANWEIKDNLDGRKRPAMETLVRRLSELPSVRVLFVSRSHTPLEEIIEGIPTKRIGESQNQHDIKKYIQHIVDKSPTFRQFFQGDPIEYFCPRSNGLFLWVELALDQLKRCRTQKQFKNCLRYMPTGSNMDEFYEQVLGRIDDGDASWVEEILRWITVVKRRLTASELQAAVEYVQKDKRLDFRSFLEKECGSMLALRPLPSHDRDVDEVAVDFIHATFKAFVTNKAVCNPPRYYVNEEDGNTSVALHCLNSLIQRNDGLMTYAYEKWFRHLQDANFQTSEFRPLTLALRQFFEGPRGVQWLRENISEQIRLSWWPGRAVPQAEAEAEAEWGHSRKQLLPYFAINEWLWMARGQLTRLGHSDNDVVGLLEDTAEILEKAMVRAWLEFDLGSLDYNTETRTNWYLMAGMHTCWQRRSKCIKQLSDIVDFWRASLEEVIKWAGGQGTSLDRGKRGWAHFYLGQWQECIHYLDGYPNFFRQVDLGNACMAVGDFTRAISIFKRLYQDPDRLGRLESDDIKFRPGLLEACLASGQIEKAIAEDTPADAIFRGYLYLAKHDYDIALQLFRQQATTDDAGPLEYKRSYIPWRGAHNIGLCTSYLLKGDFKGGIADFERRYPPVFNRTYERCLLELRMAEMNETESLAWRLHNAELLADAILHRNHDWLLDEVKVHFLPVLTDALMIIMKEKDSFNTQQAVDYILEPRLPSSPQLPDANDWNWRTSPQILADVLNAYYKTGCYDMVINTFEKATERRSYLLNPIYLDSAIACLFDAYVAKCNFDKGLAFLNDLELNGRNVYGAKISSSILKFLKAMNASDRAVEVFESAVKCNPMSRWSWHMLGRAYEAKNEYQAAIETYQQALRFLPVDSLLYKRIGDSLRACSAYEEALDVFGSVSCKNDGTILYAYLGDPADGARIPLDEHLGNYFLWWSIGQARLARDKCDTTIFEDAIRVYKGALEHGTNTLHWEYGEPNARWGIFDVFTRHNCLPRSVLWSAIGKAYEGKGETQSANKAYLEASKLQPNNVWLRKIALSVSMEETSAHHDDVVLEERFVYPQFRIPIDRCVRTSEFTLSEEGKYSKSFTG